MPGKNNASAAKGKGFNRKNQYADKANKKVLSDLLTEGYDEKSMRIAKVTKNVGNSRFIVSLDDGRDEVNALVRPVLRGKQATPIAPGSILLVGLPNWEKEAGIALASGGTLVKDPVTYVEAVLDKKAVRQLDKEGKIPKAFLAGVSTDSGEEDAGFDFEEEVAENEVVGGAEEAKEEKKEEVIDGTKPVAKWTGQRGKPVDEEAIFNFE